MTSFVSTGWVGVRGARFRLAPLTLALALLWGCAAKRPVYNVPVVHLPERYAHAPKSATQAAPEGGHPTGGGGRVQIPAEAVAGEAGGAKVVPAHAGWSRKGVATEGMLDEWWRQLGNPELDGLIGRALIGNHDLRVAALRIEQGKARLGQAAADRVPVISLPYEAKTSVPEGGVGTVRPGGALTSINTYQLSLQGVWRADVWGERAALHESAEMQMWRASFQRDDVQRTLVADIVSAYAEYLSLNDRLRVARETDTVLGEMLAAVEARLESGDATITEFEQQKTAVFSVRATLPTLEQQRVAAQNRIAFLIGTVPEALELSDQGLDALKFPVVIPDLPSILLLRRPDVRVTEARLLSADADIDVARARLLPPLDLTAEAGYGSLFFSRLIKPYTFIGSLVANLTTTVFDRGRRAKEVEFSESLYQEMMETYVRVIYLAVREVDDALSAVRLMGRRADAQQLAVDAARRAWDYSVESYKAGAVDYLVVLDSERTYHRNLDDWYGARLERYRGLVNLYSALGGGVPVRDVLPGKGARPQPLLVKHETNPAARGATPVLPVRESPAVLPADRVIESPLTAPPAGMSVPEREPARPRPSVEGAETTRLASLGGVETARSAVQAPAREVAQDATWMVEMSGLHSRAAMVVLWQELKSRFGSQLANYTMLPRRQAWADDAAENVLAYRLYITRFDDRRAADTLCAGLRAAQLECRVITMGDYSRGSGTEVNLARHESGI